MKPRTLFLSLFAFWLALDLATKEWALATLRGDPAGIEVVPDFFYLRFAQNYGAAFGVMRDYPAVLPFLVAALLVWMAWMARSLDWSRTLTPVACALVAAGAIGNLTDRLRHGFVVDFLDFWFWGWNYPTFNVADSGICVGLVALVLADLFAGPARQPAGVN